MDPTISIRSGPMVSDMFFYSRPIVCFHLSCSPSLRGPDDLVMPHIFSLVMSGKQTACKPPLIHPPNHYDKLLHILLYCTEYGTEYLLLPVKSLLFLHAIARLCSGRKPSGSRVGSTTFLIFQ